MASQHHGQDGRQNNTEPGQSQQTGRGFDGMTRSETVAQRLRNEESWVEISSQPSSSSLSSIGDEIVTTGLRVQQGPVLRRRRRSQPSAISRNVLLPRTTSTSSQEEYDESESDEDHVMTSSNEHVPSFSRVPPVVTAQADLGSESDDDDENATALGRVCDEPGAFTPQPNAFSHPPTSQNLPRAVPGSYFPSNAGRNPNQRHSYSSRGSSRPHHSPYQAVHPSHRVDHEEALRASLTTLLSCAAAARGLPKRTQGQQGSTATGRPEFNGFRLVSEAEVNGTNPTSPSTRPRSSPSLSSQDAEKGKRKASSPVGASPAGPAKPATQSRATKKKKFVGVEEAMISPTLLTWVVSAGVVVLVSVVGFGAGYVIGREVGRQETIDGLSGGASCGKEMVRSSGGLRKFRWGGTRGITA